MLEGGVEVWRGGVNAWQCDQMGHLNVRFHVAHAMEGLAGLAGALGMTQAFAPRGASTLQVREHHIRFLREARLGDPLHMTAGVLELGEDDARLALLLMHAGGAAATIVQTVVRHVETSERRRFPWPGAVRRKADSLKVRIPDGLGPRSLEPGASIAHTTLAKTDSAGLKPYAAGTFGPEDCDVFGRVAPHRLMARMHDGAGIGIAMMRTAVGEDIGFAVVEYRIVYFEPPGPGDRFLVRSGLVQAEPRRIGWTYWAFDAETGAPIATARSVLVPFDLEARKAMTLADDAVAKLKAQVVQV
jgi:acyl-CoA thioester hydrolase